jgi:hypothetical protein
MFLRPLARALLFVALMIPFGVAVANRTVSRGTGAEAAGCMSLTFAPGETAVFGSLGSSDGTIRIPELGLTAPISDGCFAFRHIELSAPRVLISFEISADDLQPAIWANEVVLASGEQANFTPSLHEGTATEREDACPALLRSAPDGLSAADQVHRTLCLSAGAHSGLPNTGSGAVACDIPLGLLRLGAMTLLAGFALLFGGVLVSRRFGSLARPS